MKVPLGPKLFSAVWRRREVGLLLTQLFSQNMLSLDCCANSQHGLQHKKCPIGYPKYNLSWSNTYLDSNSKSVISLVPRLFGGGGKRAWYLLFAHALNYLTFQSFWISPGTSVLCWRHQPLSRTLNFTLENWIARFCTLLNASAVLLWLWKTNKQLASRPSMKERTYFSDCLQVLAARYTPFLHRWPWRNLFVRLSKSQKHSRGVQEHTKLCDPFL